MNSSASLWRYVVNFKWPVKILSIFIAFLENMNFTSTEVKLVKELHWYHEVHLFLFDKSEIDKSMKLWSNLSFVLKYYRFGT